MDKLGEISGLLIGFLLTVFVYSFAVRDNPMYRLAVHILVGVSAGFAAVVVTREVLIPVLKSPFSSGDRLPLLMWLIPVALALMMLLKMVPKFSWLGNSAMAVLIAVGAAVGLVGAIVGTLLPQITATYDGFLLTLVVTGLTVCVLAYFHFTGRLTADGQVMLPVWYQYVSLAGQVVITVALAGIFAGLLSTSLILLTERMWFYLDSFTAIFTG